MAAVSSPQLPGAFQPYNLLNGTTSSRDSGALKALLAEPLEFKETASVVNSLEPGERGWIEVNPLPKTLKAEQPASVLPAASSSSESSPSKQNVKSLYSGAISLTFPETARTIGTGFNNPHNNCYLNSVLQAVIHTPGLAHLLLAHDKATCVLFKKDEFCTMCGMKAVYIHSFNKNIPNGTYLPTVITKNLKKIAKPLKVGRQEDSHEFLRFLIDGLQNSELWQHGNPKNINGDLKYSSSIHQLFGGRLRSRVTCSKCQHPSDTFDAFLDLSVEVRQCSSVKNAFDKFVKMDRLEGQNKYKCDKCKVLVNATKQLTVDEAPKALVVHLKRFTPTGGKIRDRIAYEQSFDLNPYMSAGQPGARYSLYAVVCHSGGGPHSGHYVAHVRSSDGRQWGYMDDSSVSKSGKVPLNLNDAYVLFYVREKGDALQRAIGTAAKQQPKANGNPFSPVVNVVKQQQQQEREQPVAGPSRLQIVTAPPIANGGVKRPHSEVKAAPEESSSEESEEEESEDEPPAPSQPARPSQPVASSSKLPFPLKPSSSSDLTSGLKPKHQPPPSKHLPSTDSQTPSRNVNVPLPSPTPGKKQRRSKDKKRARVLDPYGALRPGAGRAGQGGGVSRFELAKGKSQGGVGLLAGMGGKGPRP